MKLNTTICSYLFFAFLVFNTLALISSEFSPIFSQVFVLLTQDGRVYDIFSLILLTGAIILLLINPMRIYRRKKLFGKTAPFMVSLVGIIVLAIVAFLYYWLWNKIFLKDSVLISLEEIENITWQKYRISIEFYISIVCWLFLALLPLLYKAFSLNLNMQNRIGKSFLILEPSLTTSVIVISASALHPYFSNIPSHYIHIPFLTISCSLLMYILIKNKNSFGFYEYANIIFLAFMILCFVLCSESILRGDFLNAQTTLYMLAVLSWCGEWVQNRDSLYDRMT